MVDLCRGPHVPNTGVLREAAVGNMTSAFWRGDATKDALQVIFFLLSSSPVISRAHAVPACKLFYALERASAAHVLPEFCSNEC